jgi:tetratricopeptide (TPR) repeat protein
MKRFAVTTPPHVSFPAALLFVVALFLMPLFVESAHGLAVVPLAGQETPAWFRLWQEARDLRGRNNEKAGEAYQQLLREKPDLEEARWEYCQLLAPRGADAAAAVCEPLPEANSDNKKYLLMTGRLALAGREYNRAVSYLQKCADAPGPHDDEAARLLVEALQHLGEVKKSLPYLEDLAQAHPDDLDLSWRLFTAARQAGDKETAIAQAISLSQANDVAAPRLLAAAEYLDKASDKAVARRAQERYLQLHPDYLPFQKTLAAAYLTDKQADKGKALPHLLALAEADQATPGQLAEIARIYRDQADIGKALHYYELARNVLPDDASLAAETAALRRKFAKSLIADIERDSALTMWNELDQVEIDRLALYAVLAEEMEKSGKRKGLLALLEVLREKSPEPDRYTLRIARLLAAEGDNAGARQMMRQVRGNAFRDAGYFRECAAIETRLGLVADALASYRQAMALKPQDAAILEEAILLAAEAGLAPELLSLEPPKNAPLPLWLTWLQALAYNGLFTAATGKYGSLLASDQLAAAEKRQLRGQRAAMYARMGRLPEAEQEYRLLIAETADPTERRRLLLALTELLLDARQTANAERWLALSFSGDKVSPALPLDDRFALARWRLELRKDSDGAARQRLRQYIDGLGKGSAHARLTPWLLLLAEGCIAGGDQAGARAALGKIEEGRNDSQEIAALRLLAETAPPGVVFASGRSDNGFSLYRQQLVAARLAERLGLFAVADALTAASLNERPDSLAAQTMRARLSMLRGHFPEAAQEYDHLQNQYTDETFFRREYMTALLAAGKTAEFREGLAKNPAIFPAFEAELLQARADWQDGKQSEALKAYETLLASLYPDDSGRDKENEESLWTIFSFSDPNEMARLEESTDPRPFWYAAAKEAEDSAREFAEREFEKTVRQEYMARRLLASRQYKSAERQYRHGLQDEPTVSAWRDLANIYQRLGQYGKEAEIYSTLSEQGQDNPELRRAIEQNRLLRAPLVSLDWNLHNQDGRDGMKNLRENALGLHARLMPSPASELTLAAENINYSWASGGSGSVIGRRLLGKLAFELSDSNVFAGELGFHTADNETKNGNPMLLYDFSLRHRFDQMLQGFIRAYQEPIDDTLTSITRGYWRQGYEGGMELDAPSGFALGTEFTYNRLTSDNNETRLNLWAAYSLYGEFSTISIKYQYLTTHQEQAGTLIVDPDTGAKENSLPYWSPGQYSLQQITASYRYLLAGLGFPGQNDSFCGFSLSAGYETEDSLLVSGSFDISLELSRHFLLKGNLLFVKSDAFQEKGGFLSLVYRW